MDLLLSGSVISFASKKWFTRSMQWRQSSVSLYSSSFPNVGMIHVDFPSFVYLAVGVRTGSSSPKMLCIGPTILLKYFQGTQRVNKHMVRTKRITGHGSRDPQQVSQDRRWCRAIEAFFIDYLTNQLQNNIRNT